ncbi:MAG TPA: hypothetical protein VLI54_02895 [Bacillota bacterium]|nr:hypothetical protein [Bacillota bacterium]
MNRNVPNETSSGVVVNLDDYRRPLEDSAAWRHRRFRRRAIAATCGALLAGGGATAVALAGMNADLEPVYCGFAIAEPGQGGQAIANTATNSQHLPHASNNLQAGEVINRTEPQAGSRYIMWISSDGEHSSTIQTDTIQEWDGLDNPCAAIPGPYESMFAITGTPPPVASVTVPRS